MSFDLLPYRDAPLTCNCVSDLERWSVVISWQYSSSKVSEFCWQILCSSSELIMCRLCANYLWYCYKFWRRLYFVFGQQKTLAIIRYWNVSKCWAGIELLRSFHRRLADGIVHCTGSATYQIFLGYRSRTRSLTLNPNPITDPKPNPKLTKTKWWNWT